MKDRPIDALARTGTLSSEELLHLSRLVTIGEQVACFAHEVKSPLTTIRGHLRLIEGYLWKDNPIRASVEVIDRASRRIEDMADRMLGFSGKRDLQHDERCDVALLIDEALRFMQPYFKGKSIEVQLHVEGLLPQVPGDQWRMVQALVNLFQNAADAMSQSERRILRVGAKLEASSVQISVADTGHGILPPDLEHIFEPFFTTKRERGSGLGLYITKRIVEEHGGTIEIETSERGTTFVISLPL